MAAGHFVATTPKPIRLIQSSYILAKPNPTIFFPPSNLRHQKSAIHYRARRKLCFTMSSWRTKSRVPVLRIAEKEPKRLLILRTRVAEKLSRKKSERFTYLVAAVMSSFGITSMAVMAVYYSFGITGITHLENCTEKAQEAADSQNPIVIPSVRVAEKLSRKKSERFTYPVAAVMSSFGITSMAVMAVYYRFYWQMEGGNVPLSEMLGIFAVSVGAAVSSLTTSQLEKLT